jgi:hypothetical protein
MQTRESRHGSTPGNRAGPETYTLAEVCGALGKGRTYIRRLQQALELPIPSSQAGYSESYTVFLRKVLALRTFSVPLEDICDLLKKEKRILELLHFDTMHEDPHWYLDGNTNHENSEHGLLLTGFDLGFPLSAEVIQANLSFRQREAELFDAREMGEDVRVVLRLYTRLLERIRARVENERHVLEDALAWAREAFAKPKK